mmetsp:Transcript_3562/g.8744  ORF Transcript_3562/g.8744 Transcript_3562/m.8744 type:complete len:342 (+) Transcript_3562:877-1902(+)
MSQENIMNFILFLYQVRLLLITLLCQARSSQGNVFFQRLHAKHQQQLLKVDNHHHVRGVNDQENYTLHRRDLTIQKNNRAQSKREQIKPAVSQVFASICGERSQDCDQPLDATENQHAVPQHLTDRKLHALDPRQRRCCHAEQVRRTVAYRKESDPGNALAKHAHPRHGRQRRDEEIHHGHEPDKQDQDPDKQNNPGKQRGVGHPAIGDLHIVNQTVLRFAPLLDKRTHVIVVLLCTGTARHRPDIFALLPGILATLYPLLQHPIIGAHSLVQCRVRLPDQSPQPEAQVSVVELALSDSVVEVHSLDLQLYIFLHPPQPVNLLFAGKQFCCPRVMLTVTGI